MEKIGAAHKIEWVHEDDILQSSFQDKSYDFVWNFAYLPACPDPDKLIEEMKRISKNMWLCSRLTQEILVFRSTGLSIKNRDSMDTWRYKVQQARLHKKKVRGTWADNCGNRFCGLSGVAGFSGISGCETAQDECGF